MTKDVRGAAGLAEIPAAPAMNNDACARLAGLNLKDVRIAGATSIANSYDCE